MAKLIDLLTFSGTLGDMVGCVGPNGFYVRKRPKKPAKPPTARQLETRAKMALVTSFLAPLRELIYLGFAQRGPASKAGAMGRAVSHALQAVVGTYPDLGIDPALIRLSRGNKDRLISPAVRLEGGVLRVTWIPHDNAMNAFGDDTVYAVAYHARDGVVIAGTDTRDAGEVHLNVSSEPPGSRLLVYAFTAERDGQRCSDSQFLGEITIP